MEEDRLTESLVQQILTQSRSITAEQFNEMMKTYPPIAPRTEGTMSKLPDCRIGVDLCSDIKSSKTLLEEVIDKNKNLLLLELPIMIKQTPSKTGYVITDKTGKEVYLEKDEDGLLFNLQEDFGI